MENVQWKVEGMDCSNCALTIHKFLEKKGARNVKVNFANGDLSFDFNGNAGHEELARGIRNLGYEVNQAELQRQTRRPFLSNHLQRFLFCLPFTLILWLHMFPAIAPHWLMNPWLQLAVCLPVFVVGLSFFGKSAYKSLRNGMPNMNVLITMGAVAAFVYSLYGTLTGQAQQYMFYETTATILTLVFMGNYLEDASIRSTQKELNKLVKSQKVMAIMIAFDDKHQEQHFQVENTQLKTGDLVLIKSGEQVPADCKILWGDAYLDESLLTGESKPVSKTKKDIVVGGSVVVDGTLKAQVTAAGDDTVLAGIIQMVKNAQGERPPVQQLADRISAVFVPVVLGIAVLTLVVNWIVLQDFTPSLMRSIAVLVIACPCAMGLATPAAIAVGMGRAARNGILFRDAKSLELFKDIKQVVFDKTGTLTHGNMKVTSFNSIEMSEDEFRHLVFSLEKYSNHPIARSLVKSWPQQNAINWKKLEEVKGRGIYAIDKDGNEYWAGSAEIPGAENAETGHQVYISKNNKLAGWISLEDETRQEARQVVDFMHSKGIKTYLLSGDSYQVSSKLASELGIGEVIAKQSPADKVKFVEKLTLEHPTMMVGDGINDAPALAKATIGISLSEASQLAMQSAQVVLVNQGLKKLPQALGLGKHTYITIKQNLFWAFAYNVVAIPVAALGFLTPGFSALVMGLSDVVLAINSVRLFVKKVV